MNGIFFAIFFLFCCGGVKHACLPFSFVRFLPRNSLSPPSPHAPLTVLRCTRMYLSVYVCNLLRLYVHVYLFLIWISFCCLAFKWCRKCYAFAFNFIQVINIVASARSLFLFLIFTDFPTLSLDWEEDLQHLLHFVTAAVCVPSACVFASVFVGAMLNRQRRKLVKCAKIKNSASKLRVCSYRWMCVAAVSSPIYPRSF